MYFLLILGQS